MKSFLFISFLAVAASAPGSRMEMELEELLDMVPYEQMVNLGMEYAMSDNQVKSLMYYISSDKFRDNLVELELTPQFIELAELLRKHKIDLYSLTNKVHSALGLPPIRHNPNTDYEPRQQANWNPREIVMNYTAQSEMLSKTRSITKRSPGDGVTGLVCEAAEMAPLAEMKEAYKYKVDHNPEFRTFMETLLNIDGKEYLAPIVKSRQFQETVKDLKDLGIPLEQLEQLISSRVHQFFDLSNNSTTIIDKTVETTVVTIEPSSEPVIEDFKETTTPSKITEAMDSSEPSG